MVTHSPYLRKPTKDRSCGTCASQKKEHKALGASRDCDRLSAFFWIGWEGAVLRAKLEQQGEPLLIFASHFYPLYRLYTSGTTAHPKGIVRDAGGHAVALHHSMSLIYGVKPGDVMCTASDVGWVVGHSYVPCSTSGAGVRTAGARPRSASIGNAHPYD